MNFNQIKYGKPSIYVDGIGGTVVYDVDAAAYFARVTAAGGSLTTPEKNAVNQLVLDMKTANIWTLQKAIYPMKGSTAASCAQNLVSSSFTGTFYGGWTFGAAGATPNGVNTYMDTGFSQSVNLPTPNAHMSYYANAGSFSGFTTAMGILQNTFVMFVSVGAVYGQLWDSDYTPYNASPFGFYCVSRKTSAQKNIYFNGSSVVTSTDSLLQGNANVNVFIGAANNYGPAGSFSALRCAFSSIGLGFTDAQETAFYNAIQTMQTSLGIQV